MGCHPSHWRTHIFQDGYCTTNQVQNPLKHAIFNGYWSIAKLTTYLKLAIHIGIDPYYHVDKHKGQTYSHIAIMTKIIDWIEMGMSYLIMTVWWLTWNRFCLKKGYDLNNSDKPLLTNGFRSSCSVRMFLDKASFWKFQLQIVPPNFNRDRLHGIGRKSGTKVNRRLPQGLKGRSTWNFTGQTLDSHG